MNLYKSLKIIAAILFLMLTASHPDKPKEPNTGSKIINAIVGKRENRYDVVTAILEKDPTQVLAISMSFSFTIYQEGKLKDNSSGSLMPLDAAINLKDFEMVKLLVEYKAPICNDQSRGQCALTNAANRGFTEIYEYLKAELIKQSKSEGLEVRFWSDKSAQERAEICKRSNPNNPAGYADCLKMKEYIFFYQIVEK